MYRFQFYSFLIALSLFYIFLSLFISLSLSFSLSLVVSLFLHRFIPLSFSDFSLFICITILQFSYPSLFFVISSSLNISFYFSFFNSISILYLFFHPLSSNFFILNYTFSLFYHTYYLSLLNFYFPFYLSLLISWQQSFSTSLFISLYIFLLLSY